MIVRRFGALGFVLLLLLLSASVVAQPERSLLRVDDRFLDSPGKEQHPQAKALVLKDDIRFELMPDGTTLFVEHDVVKVLDADGVKDYTELSRVYDGRGNTLEVVEARTISPKGDIYEVTQIEDEPLTRRHEAYKHLRHLKITFPKLEPGGFVEFHLRSQRAPKPDKAWWATTYVQNPDPILHSTFTAVVPAGERFHYATPGFESFKPKKTRKDGQDVYYWEVSNQLALESEPSMPPVLQVLRRIEISSFGNWSELGAWLYKRWDEGARGGERIDVTTAGLLPTAGDSDAKLAAVLEWVEKDRETVDFMVEDYQPKDPLALLDQERLSPVDMAGLLAVMLEFAGFQVEPIYSLGTPESEQQSGLAIPSRIEQILLRLTGPDGQRWVDPETPGEFYRNPPAGFQNMSGVLASQRKPGLVTLGNDPPDNNRQELQVEARVDARGRAEIGLKIAQHGLSGTPWRELARTLSARDRQVRERTLDKLFSRLATSISPRARVHARYFDFKAQTGQPLDMSATLIIPGYVTPADGEFQVPLPIQTNEQVRGLLNNGLSRRYPVRFPHTFRDETRVHIVLPEGSKVTEMPASFQVDTPTAAFLSTSRVDNHEAWYYSRLIVKKPWVTLEELEDLLRVAEKMAESQQGILKYVRTETRDDDAEATEEVD